MRFMDLRDKQVEESGVGGIRRDRSVASVQEDIVPGGGRTMGFRSVGKILKESVEICYVCSSSWREDRSQEVDALTDWSG